jgi:hypothetical protein
LFMVAIVAGVLVARAVLGSGEEAKAIDPTSEILKRLEVLETRVAELEKMPRMAIPNAVGQSPAAPRNWGSSVINGQTIYIVPLSATKDSPQAPIAVQLPSR